MTEQRADERQDISGTGVDVMDVESGVAFHGDARNVSGHGLLFHATMEPPVGADLEVTLGSTRAELHVTRVERSADGGYDVAGTLRRR